MTAIQRRRTNGLRPFDLAHDLDGVADLIEVAFGEETQRPWMRVQDEMRSMRRLGPLLWLLARLGGGMPDGFAGFVWEEGGRIVGNVSIGRVGGDPRRWIIGNVGVHPEYRRRGIARELTQAAISAIRMRGGEWVVLDVRADNAPAYQLYRELGFHLIDVTHELHLRGVQPRLLVIPPGVGVRPATPGDFRRLREIRRRSVPPAVQEVFPERGRRLLVETFTNLLPAALPFLRGELPFLLVAECAATIVAFGQISPRPQVRTLRLHSLPEQSAAVDFALASVLVATARRRRTPALMVEVRESHATALDAFRRLGFETDQIMHRLALRLRPARRSPPAGFSNGDG